MFTAAANNTVAKSESFLKAVDLLKWNQRNSENFQDGYGFSGESEILAQKLPGSDGAPSSFDKETGYYAQTWETAADVFVPAGFEPIRGENVIYAVSVAAYVEKSA